MLAGLLPLPLPATNVATTVDKLNLGRYTAPVVAQVGAFVGPHYQTASRNLLPILSPYMDLAAPYIGGAKPHLNAVSQKETLFILGQDTQQARAAIESLDFSRTHRAHNHASHAVCSFSPRLSVIQVESLAVCFSSSCCWF
jgi:hypothetical protein